MSAKRWIFAIASFVAAIGVSLYIVISSWPKACAVPGTDAGSGTREAAQRRDRPRTHGLALRRLDMSASRWTGSVVVRNPGEGSD